MEDRAFTGVLSGGPRVDNCRADVAGGKGDEPVTWLSVRRQAVKGQKNELPGLAKMIRSDAPRTLLWKTSYK
jgi:hypothetical protein